MLCGAHLYSVDPKLRCCYCCTYFIAHAAAACLLHFSLSLYYSHLCIFSNKLAKLKGLLRVQSYGRRKDESQRSFIPVLDRLGLSILWVPNMRATRIVGHPSLTLPSVSSHPTPSPPHALRNTFCLLLSLHIKSRSDLYSVPSNIRTGSTDANASRGHRLTTPKGYITAAYKTRKNKMKNFSGS